MNRKIAPSTDPGEDIVGRISNAPGRSVNINWPRTSVYIRAKLNQIVHGKR